MIENNRPNCPECEQGAEWHRRDFIAAGASSLIALGAAQGTGLAAFPDQPAAQPAQPARQAKPAEALIRELYQGMTAEQRANRNLVYPWNDDKRRGMFNAPFGARIGDAYTRPQQELVERILKAISSGDDGFSKLTRGGTYDGSRSLQGCGAYIFGEPADNRQFAWVFAGHHITVRCDGNSEANAAFGGPMYYGHSPDGHSRRNVFNFQTRSVQTVFDALTENQRRSAIITGRGPGENAPSIRFREANQARPGIAARDLTADQRRLVETVLRDLLQPYRREDADEVMALVQRNGGIERLHLAFYRDEGVTETDRWSFWRVEGPGFVWNYRVLPHVHTYVNIAGA